MAAAYTSPYVYQTLKEPTKQLRLLRFRHSWETVPLSPVIEIILTTFEIGPAPQYTALSYTWGEPDAMSRCSIDGCALSVTPNCAHALQQLHRRDRGKSDWYWIDAICINQEDLDEKKYQVAMMGDLYRSAQAVVISLSQETTSGRLAFVSINEMLWQQRQARLLGAQSPGLMEQESDQIYQYSSLSQLCHIAMAKGGGRKGWDRTLWWTAAAANYLCEDEADSDGTSARTIAEIQSALKLNENDPLGFHRDRKRDDKVHRINYLSNWLRRVSWHAYWSRRWIVPECYHGKLITLLDAQLEAPLHCVGVFVDVLQNTIKADKTLGQILRARNLLNTPMAHLCKWLVAARNVEYYTQDSSILETLRACSGKFCRDPRDMLYSVLSIVKWPSNWPLVEADYGITMMELAAQVTAVASLDLDGSLDVVDEVLELLACPELTSEFDTALVRHQQQPSKINVRSPPGSEPHISSVKFVCESIQFKLGESDGGKQNTLRIQAEDLNHSHLSPQSYRVLFAWSKASSAKVCEQNMDFGHLSKTQICDYVSRFVEAQDSELARCSPTVLQLNGFTIGVACGNTQAGDILQKWMGNNNTYIVLRRQYRSQQIEIIGYVWLPCILLTCDDEEWINRHENLEASLDPEDMMILGHMTRFAGSREPPEWPLFSKLAHFLNSAVCREPGSSFMTKVDPLKQG